MTAYYNEFDPHAAQWLRNLIAAGVIAPGDVDERSIEDVTPNDLRGYTQCHFFAGIGGWAYALDLAGWPRDRPVWTGSCPCQPFSAAGKGAGFEDERHLWPAWQHLINQCRPPVIFGEQVASKAVDAWIDLVHTDMEGMGYAFGSVPFPAAGVGAPHIRDRNYWLGHANGAGLEGHAGNGGAAGRQGSRGSVAQAGLFGGVGHPDSGKPDGFAVLRGDERDGTNAGRAQGGGGIAACSDDGRLADPDGGHASAEREQRSGQQRQQPQDGGACDVADATGSGRREERADAGGFACGDRSQGFAAGLVRGSDDLLGLGNTNCATGERGAGSILGTKTQINPARINDGCEPDGLKHASEGVGERPGPTNGHWRAADWLGCRDGKWRPVEPSVLGVVDGLPGDMVRSSSVVSASYPLAQKQERRVMRLRGYGNAIVPQAAAEFISAYAEAVGIRSESALDLFAA